MRRSVRYDAGSTDRSAEDRAARAAIRELDPDVVIVDLSLTQGDGLELVRDVHAQRPGLPMLVLSMHDESVYAERSLRAGANGYIMKRLR